MNKETNTNIITVEELIAQKEKLLKREKSTAIVHIKSLDRDVKVEEPSAAALADIDDMEKDFANKYIVYECLVEPNIKDPAMREAFGNPAVAHDILDYILKKGEIERLSGVCASLAGYGRDSVEIIKN